MDAEEQPADPDKMKEQVVVSLSEALTLFYFVSPSATLKPKKKKSCNKFSFFSSLVSHFQQKMRIQFLLIQIRALSPP